MKWKRSKKAHQEAKAKAADERKKAKAKLIQQVSCPNAHPFQTQKRTIGNFSHRQLELPIDGVE